MNYLGIDIGTSGCKAVVFSPEGKQLAHAHREYDLCFFNNGGAEIDSKDVLEKCFAIIKECTSQTEPGSVIGLGISSQGEAFTAIGENNDILSNAMVSSDKRSADLVEHWSGHFGKERLYKTTGHTAHPMFTLFKLLWLKKNKPQVWEKAHFFLCFEDLLQLKLGLDPSISWSLAGRTMMFDVIKHRWDPAILAAIGLPENKLARPLKPGSVAGGIPSQIIQELGLARGAFVVAAGHDQPCGALGAGVTKQGMAMYATGSVECITPVMDIFSKSLQTANLCTYDHVVDGMYTTVAFNLTGGNILKWFRDEFGYQEMAEAEKTAKNAYDLLLEEAGYNPSGLLVLPYFTPSGTPYFDTEIKGAILGLQLSTKRGEVIRALLEGVAFEMRLNMEILEGTGYQIDELFSIGGGSKSSLWAQLKADVSGKTISTVATAEAGCLGAAMLACAAITQQSIVKLASIWVRQLSTIKPDPVNTDFYSDKFRTYKRLYQKIRAVNL